MVILATATALLAWRIQVILATAIALLAWRIQVILATAIALLAWRIFIIKVILVTAIALLAWRIFIIKVILVTAIALLAWRIQVILATVIALLAWRIQVILTTAIVLLLEDFHYQGHLRDVQQWHHTGGYGAPGAGGRHRVRKRYRGGKSGRRKRRRDLPAVPITKPFCCAANCPSRGVSN